MNVWQKIILGIGALALILFIIFPPQFSVSRSIEYIPFWYGNPIAWFRLLFWILIILLVTGFGIIVNKSDHYR